MNLVLLQSHGQLEYPSGKYFRKKIKAGMNKGDKF